MVAALRLFSKTNQPNLHFSFLFQIHGRDAAIPFFDKKQKKTILRFPFFDVFRSIAIAFSQKIDRFRIRGKLVSSRAQKADMKRC
jgi:hypothetical protein